MIAEDNIDHDFLEVAVVDFQKMGDQVGERPEDFIFILTPDEWNKYMELNQEIFHHFKTGAGLSINQEEYTSKYQGPFMIVAISIQPDFARKYKVGGLTHALSLGKSHAVFFVKRSNDETNRTNQVLKRIIDFKINNPAKDNANN